MFLTFFTCFTLLVHETRHGEPSLFKMQISSGFSFLFIISYCISPYDQSRFVIYSYYCCCFMYNDFKSTCEYLPFLFRNTKHVPVVNKIMINAHTPVIVPTFKWKQYSTSKTHNKIVLRKIVVEFIKRTF